MVNGVDYPSGSEVTLKNGDKVTLEYYDCLASSTPIRMADGTTKPICEVKVGDEVACVNPETGELDKDTVTYADGHVVFHSAKMCRWTFEDGTVVETVGRHRFYNVELGEMMYLEAWNIGEHARLDDGREVALVRREDFDGDFDHCTIFTEKWNNYFAGGLLCGNRKSAKIGGMK